MTGLSERYSRHNFESSTDGESLAHDLAKLLTERLRSAEDARVEADTIILDLKTLGHELFSWDEAPDSRTWGDDYVRPKRTRIVVELRFPDDDTPSASVDFGPWPVPAPETPCPRCHKPMTATSLRVHGVGHGHAVSREVDIEVFLGDLERQTFSAGQRSRGLQVSGLWCASCSGLWLPDTTRIGWTGRRASRGRPTKVSKVSPRNGA
jgi:hypothetical protein